MTKLFSLAICLIILLGVSQRQNKRVHIPIMALAFVLDMSLFLYVELTKDALNTAFSSLHPFVVFHVFLSVSFVLAYFLQIGSGIFKLQKGRAEIIHKYNGVFFLVMRLGSFVTSLFVGKFINL